MRYVALILLFTFLFGCAGFFENRLRLYEACVGDLALGGLGALQLAADLRGKMTDVAIKEGLDKVSMSDLPDKAVSSCGAALSASRKAIAASHAKP